MFIDVPTDNCVIQAAPQDLPSLTVIKELSPYPAANVGDAMNRLNLMHSSIRPQWPGSRCTGRALTVLTRDGDNLAIHRALDMAQAGDVLVVNALAGDTRAVFGDLLAEICLSAAIAGVVIDGATRDRAAIEAMGLPLWARSVSPAGPAKNGPGAVNVPIACGGVVVNPGDIIVADGDGVAVVPHADAPRVIARLAEIDQFERGFRTRVREHYANTQGTGHKPTAAK